MVSRKIHLYVANVLRLWKKKNVQVPVSLKGVSCMKVISSLSSKAHQVTRQV